MSRACVRAAMPLTEHCSNQSHIRDGMMSMKLTRGQIMVRWEGVEPPTSWFVARRSIQLSYQRAMRGVLSGCGPMPSTLNLIITP